MACWKASFIAAAEGISLAAVADILVRGGADMGQPAVGQAFQQNGAGAIPSIVDLLRRRLVNTDRVAAVPLRRGGLSCRPAPAPAIAMDPPTTAEPPRKPTAGAVRCIAPPKPRDAPVAFPSTSAMRARRLPPLARKCPWLRCVLT